MTQVRDTARQRVYNAEKAVRALFDSAERHDVRTVTMYGSTLMLPVERKFASVESVQSYVDAVLALHWVRGRWPNAARPVAVRARRGQSYAHYESSPPTIAVPLHQRGRAWALRELVVLHEIAHHLSPDGAAHDQQFVDAFCVLVGEIIGPEAGLILRAAVHECGAG